MQHEGAHARPQPDGTVPLAGRIALLSTNLIICLGLFSLGPALPAVRLAFHNTPMVDIIVPLIGSAAGFSFALTSLCVGPPVNRYGYRVILVTALLLFAGAALVPLLLPNLTVLLASRIIVGIASGFIVNASVAAVGTLFSPGVRTRLLGIQTLGGSVAAILLFPLSGMLSGIDWRLSIALDAIALLLVPAMLTLPRPVAVAAASVLAPIGRTGVGTLLAASLVGVAIFVTAVFGALYLSQHGVHNSAELSVPSTAAAIGSLVGSSSYVALGPRFGIRRSFIGSLLLVASGLAIAGCSTTTLPFSLGILIASIGTGIFLPNLNAAAVRSAPTAPARAIGLVNATLYGSMILFPMLVLPLALALASIGSAILALASLAMLAALGFAIRFDRSDRTAAGPGFPIAERP